MAVPGPTGGERRRADHASRREAGHLTMHLASALNAEPLTIVGPCCAGSFSCLVLSWSARAMRGTDARQLPPVPAHGAEAGRRVRVRHDGLDGRQVPATGVRGGPRGLRHRRRAGRALRDDLRWRTPGERSRSERGRARGREGGRKGGGEGERGREGERERGRRALGDDLRWRAP
eukprot:2529066-Rhodomonas_salina.2